ncbi:hypothetical protein COV04_01365 [Candidatus Uhrbacteria bacterium CG10_big_fil_rev_8_21_14_0_10_48_11]|uniref:RNA polymerase sigma factor n=1 Tax=Candidatus Uhrbacteria bacterium CG10_big_fil_rev_8_21_14_0_10_48_11 TaxID=1975037 RepID=A0A2M8LFD7_9BACT|nr:MAG: hypothetical protein COV04_01365 [Candidatus Uhrbacteria bacterium CG10_big_fil_rev_8_21_14_0_10_48_11]
MVQDNQTEHEFTRIYEECADGIFRLCYYRVYSRERAFELTQETFLKVWQYLCEGKHIDNLKAFLYKTARNLIIDESRKKMTDSLDALQEQGFDPPDNKRGPERQAEGSIAKDHLARLTEPYRTAVELRYLDDLSLQEIALVTDSNENAVGVRIHRAIEQLRTLLS